MIVCAASEPDGGAGAADGSPGNGGAVPDRFVMEGFFAMASSPRAGGQAKAPVAVSRPSPVRELLLAAGLFLAYELDGWAGEGSPGAAHRNAHDVRHLEQILRLPDEETLQRALSHSDPLVHAATTCYAAVHVPATVVFLVWMYRRHPARYVWIRRALTGLAGVALVLHLLLPMAPPRMPAGTGPPTGTLPDDYGAMPSLYVGCAVAVAVGLIVTTRGRLRWLWLLHPLLTLLVVVATAADYWLDGIVTCARIGAVLLFVRVPAPESPGTPDRRARRHPLTRVRG
jgi:hypothetical protein